MKGTVMLADVSVSFFNQTVLNNVHAEFPANQISVLVGRSGSGKTTILRTVNRLNEEFPGCRTSGQVNADFGQGPQNIYAPGISLAQLRLRVGMLFQTPNCFPVSVYRNIAMPLELVAGTPTGEIPGKVQASLESVGLWAELQDRLDAPAERLSGGQQQRLCLARLLALQPAILLLDEPTASLDVHAARGIEELLRELAAKYTIIMVSHELSQARRLADQALICANGEIVGVIKDKTQLCEDRLAEIMQSADLQG